MSDESGAEWPADMLARVTSAVMPVPTYLELGMVLESRFGLPATGAAARFVVLRPPLESALRKRGLMRCMQRMVTERPEAAQWFPAFVVPPCLII